MRREGKYRVVFKLAPPDSRREHEGCVDDVKVGDVVVYEEGTTRRRAHVTSISSTAWRLRAKPRGCDEVTLAFVRIIEALRPVEDPGVLRERRKAEARARRAEAQEERLAALRAATKMKRP